MLSFALNNQCCSLDTSSQYPGNRDTHICGNFLGNNRQCFQEKNNRFERYMTPYVNHVNHLVHAVAKMAEGIDPCCSSSTSSPSDCDSRHTITVSLLDKLRGPALSELSRKRKVHANPPTGKKRSLAQTASKFDPQSIKSLQRASVFPGEYLVVSAGKLFCKACREIVAVKRSVVVNRIKSKKHADSKERLQGKTGRERDMLLHCKSTTARHTAEVRRYLIHIKYIG